MIWIVGGIIILVVLFLILDRIYNQIDGFYPSIMEILAVYTKALLIPLYKGFGWKKIVKPGYQLKNLDFTLKMNPSTDNIDKFYKTCELNSNAEEIPLLYPATIMLYPTACMLCEKRYPFPVLGSVHVSNYFRFLRPIKKSESFTCDVKADEDIKFQRSGIEVKFPSVLKDKDNNPVWYSTSNIMVLHKHKYWDGPNVKPAPEEIKGDVVATKAHKFPADIGRRYGSVVSDYNPIHMYPITAAMFGFPKQIAHGMYVLTRAVDLCLQEAMKELKYPLESDVRFKKPVFLPAKNVLVKITREQLPEGVTFRYYVEDSVKGTLHLSGYLREYRK